MFIFESFGTSELLLVGLVALVLLGPRKLPEMARKAGKMMAEFRGTANEFKETWQREVNFEEEAKALNLKALEAEPVKRDPDSVSPSPVEPSIKEIDPERVKNLASQTPQSEEQPSLPLRTVDVNDKKNWL